MITYELLNSEITSTDDLSRYYIFREGFVFTSLDEPANVFDAIVIRYPASADCICPRVGFSTRSLNDHIAAIKAYGIKKAVIIAENIDFILDCPMLEGLHIIPANTAPDQFDYSPLYQLYNISSLQCHTVYGVKEEMSTCVDYSRIHSPLIWLGILGKGHLNYQKIPTLERLSISDKQLLNLDDFVLPRLIKLSMLQCGLRSLKGIENCPNLQWLDMSYLRNLIDISAISSLAPALRSLAFENCPRVTDFSVISKLNALEYLEMKGKNELPNLDFIKVLPKLKFVALSMTVVDGNVDCLRNIQYADAVCKRHYTLKNKDLPKDRTNLGFQFL